jgi:hypothetical protein
MKSLWHWSSKLGRVGRSEAAGRQGKPRMRLARVARSTQSLSQEEPASIVVEIGAARLTVRGQVDAAALRAVVVGLREAGLEAVR